MSTKEKNFKCEFCSKRFKREYDFLKHVRILHKSQTKEDFSCDLCSKIFTTLMSLKKHKWDYHESVKKNYCDICGLAFSKSSELNFHVDKVHKGKCICSECGKDFGHAENLKRHIQCVHEGRRDYNCSECGKVFGQPGDLKRHIKCVHEGQRDYNCLECGKDFGGAGVLKKHIQCVHEGRRDYNCLECGKNLSTAQHLKKHIERFHEKSKADRIVSDVDNSEIVHETNTVQIPESNYARNEVIYENMEVKMEQFEVEEMPTFESESTYLDKKIKKEVKIEPLESINDGQMFQHPDTRRKSKEKNDLNSHFQSRIYEKSRNMVSNDEIKKEDNGSEEMPIFEKDSTYLEQEIKKEIKIEANW